MFCSLMNLTSEWKKIIRNNLIDKNWEKHFIESIISVRRNQQSQRAITVIEFTLRKIDNKMLGKLIHFVVSVSLILWVVLNGFNLIFMCVFFFDSKEGSDGHLCCAICCNDRHLYDKRSKYFFFVSKCCWYDMFSSLGLYFSMCNCHTLCSLFNQIGWSFCFIQFSIDRTEPNQKVNVCSPLSSH